MSNEVSIFSGQRGVVKTKDRGLTALGKQIQSSNTVVSRRIQANINGTFKKIINGEQVGEAIRGEFHAIIVSMLPNVSRIFYAEKFDPNKEATLPNCWSNNNDKPEANVPEKQHANCADCPMNIAGSGENGGRACRYQRRVAIMLEGDPSGTVYQFNIPAKSLFGKGQGNVHPFESYTKYLVNNGFSPDLVVTKISFDDNADGMELLFSPVRELSDEEYDLVIAAQSRPETAMYTKITVGQVDGVTKQPAIAHKATEQKAARAEEPEEDEDEEEEIKEPVKRAPKKAAATPAKTQADLASVIDEWGQDE